MNSSDQFSNMIQFPMESYTENNKNNNIKFAYHIRTLLNISQSTLTVSLLCKGQTGLKDLFHSANIIIKIKYIMAMIIVIIFQMY